MANDSEALVPAEGEIVEGLVVRRSPDVVLDEARKAAVALQSVIASKPKKVQFNGEQYLEFEDWQTLGRFYGITSKVESTSYVEYGKVHGFEARAVALNAHGDIISAAEAACLTDEEKWGLRAKYEWRGPRDNRERVHVGDEPVPLFQLKSMAQTRAQSKVLRSVLAWVAVLAGYGTTPAEELDGLATHTETAKPATQAAKPATNGGSTTAPTATKAAPPAQTTAAPPTGLYVTHVSTKSGKNSRGDYTSYSLTLSDGRKCSTFSDTDGKIAQESADTKRPVVIEMTTTEKGDKTYHNVKSIAFADAPAQTDKPAAAKIPSFAYRAADADKEVVGGPEKVLGVIGWPKDAPRPEDHKYWEVRTDRRTYVTNKQDYRDQLEGARTLGARVVITFLRKSLGADKADWMFSEVAGVEEFDEGAADRATAAPVVEGEVVPDANTPAFG